MYVPCSRRQSAYDKPVSLHSQFRSGEDREAACGDFDDEIELAVATSGWLAPPCGQDSAPAGSPEYFRLVPGPRMVLGHRGEVLICFCRDGNQSSESVHVARRVCINTR